MSKTYSISAIILLAALAVHWSIALFWMPVDFQQGEVYRIIYLHVPAAFAAFSGALFLLLASLWALKTKSSRSLYFGRASAEVGLLYTVLTLATGSIWGKPTWGTWWTWDARLTTTLLLGILYVGYLILYNALPSGLTRIKSCAVLGILIFIDVPIIYKSVTWWRTLHQPQTILRPGGGTSTMDPEMLWTLVGGIVLHLLICAWMIAFRRKNLALAESIENQSLRQSM